MESNDNRLEELLRQMYAEERPETSDVNEDKMSDIIDEEWQKFLLRQANKFEREAEHFAAKQRSRNWMKIAAMFFGVLMLSGIAYAAVHIISHNVGVDEKIPTQEVSRRNGSLVATKEPSLIADSTAQPRLYDNVHLGEILDELSTYYHIKVVYYTEDARHPRLYYQWKPEYTIEKVVEMLNNFEWLQMELKNDTLYVKSTAIPAHDC